MIDALGNNINNSVASGGYNFTSNIRNQESIFLEEKLQEIKDEQGFLGKAWNGVKELTTLGVSESDCEKMLDKYNNGEISFEEAIEYLDKYDSKQENMSGLLSNIATGVASIAAATAFAAGGPIGWFSAAFFVGGGVGAVTKTGINMIDRATNKVEGDALDGKQIAKDAISGTITGATSAVWSNIGQGYKTIVNGAATKGSITTSIKNGVVCGLECGALSGSTSYLTDVAFGDKEYDTGELIGNTLTSSMVSGAVGGVVGAGMYGLTGLKVDKAVANSASLAPKTLTRTIATDSSTSSARKILGNSTKKALGLA